MLRTDQFFALGVTAFVGYNTAVILWELKKPNSTECPKCAWTRIAVGAGLAATGLVLAFKDGV